MIVHMKQRSSPESPEDRAKSKARGPYSLYLRVEQMRYIEDRAVKAGLSKSELVDMAIAFYIASLKDKKHK